VTDIPEKTRGYYVHVVFVCPEPGCFYPNEKRVLVFAETEQQARGNVTLICESCRKPVSTSYLVFGVEEARESG